MRHSSHARLSRRQLLCGVGAVAALLPAGRGQATQPRQFELTLYRDRGCGCCLAWGALARRAGHIVQVVDSPDMAAVKRRLGVPARLWSCHTATIGNYVIEGHVPLERVARMLQTQPRGVRGLAVPGMPVGSPGMEAPDGRRDLFDVWAFDANGRAMVVR